MSKSASNVDTGRKFKVGDMLTDAEAAFFLEGRGGGWFRDARGREVYACDGSHKDGTRGFKVIQLDGLK